MRRALVLTSASLLLGGLMLTGLTGCSSDPRDVEIKKIVALLEEASTDVISVADSIKSAVKKAQDDPEKKEVTEDALKPAFEAIETLKKLGGKFQYVKSRIDSIPDVPTEDQKQAYVRENKADIERNLDRLVAAQKQLETVLKDAAPYMNRDAMASLQTKLKEAEEPFLTLGQRA
jgi:small-conductance mechanosensitive channel